MPETGGGDHEPVDRRASNDHEKAAWKHTLEDMERMVEDLEEGGWEVLSVISGHTYPDYPGHKDTDQFGFVHILPGNRAEEFVELFNSSEFDAYDVFRQGTDQTTFLVTALLDEDGKRAIFVAGAYETSDARELYETAQERGEVRTHFQKLDGTHLGSMRHEDYNKFFPKPSEIGVQSVTTDLLDDI